MAYGLPRCRQRRQQQLGQVRTRTAEARADAAAQATAFKSSTRGQEAARLAAENKALLEVLSQATDGNPELQERLSSIRSRYATSVRLCLTQKAACACVATRVQRETPPRKEQT